MLCQSLVEVIERVGHRSDESQAESKESNMERRITPLTYVLWYLERQEHGERVLSVEGPVVRRDSWKCLDRQCR